MSQSETAAPASSTGQLRTKLLGVAQAIDNIEKTGRNDHHRYDYVEAAEVFRRIRSLLYEQRIIVVPGATSPQHFTETGGKGFVTTVELSYTFVDCDSGEQVVVPWVGAGADVGGDKGLYKAYTGGLKYALLALFLIPTGDDPETDHTSEPQRGGTVAQDAERPAAPRIPLDRAKAILESAKAAGLVSDDDSFTPVLKAKLADVGVDKIGALNVDQAEAVEAFIAEEAEAARTEREGEEAS